MSESSAERNPAQEVAAAQHLEDAREWGRRFGSNDFQDRAAQAYDRLVDRVGYDPLDEQEEV